MTSSASTNGTSVVRRSIGQTFLQSAITIVIIALIMFAIIDAWTSRDVEDWLIRWIELIENHLILGIFVVIAVYILASIFFVPQSVLSVCVGYAFGQAFPNMPMLSIPLASCVSKNVIFFEKVISILAMDPNDFYC
jgi:hypothetical protein